MCLAMVTPWRLDGVLDERSGATGGQSCAAKIKNNKPDFLNAEVSNKNALNNSQGYIP